MAGLDITIVRDPRVFARRDAKIKGLIPRLLTAAKEVMETEQEEAIRFMQRNYLSAARTTRTRLARRTGALHDSFRHVARIDRAEKVVQGRVFQLRGATGALGARPAVYGPVHERGAIIVPRRAQFLKIPLTDAARERPNAFRKLFSLVSRAGNLFLARAVSKGVIELVFLLRKSVRIPARPFLRPSMDRYERRLKVALQRAYRRVRLELRKR